MFASSLNMRSLLHLFSVGRSAVKTNHGGTEGAQKGTEPRAVASGSKLREKASRSSAHPLATARGSVPMSALRASVVNRADPRPRLITAVVILPLLPPCLVRAERLPPRAYTVAEGLPNNVVY